MRGVLHIALWYPNKNVPQEAPFVERHVRALEPHAHGTVWHIDVRHADRWHLLRESTVADRTLVLFCPVKRWLLIEWMASLLIIWAWVTRDRRVPIDLVNFHVAYPNCAWIRTLRALMRRPMVITEHYSAYHFKFHGTGEGMRRIKRIFQAGVPVIAVSRALAEDIRTFVGPPEPRFFTVDNAVDTELFKPDAGIAPEPGRFFALAGWRKPKRPDVLIEALARLRAQGMNARLRLGGEGPMDADIRERIRSLGLQDHVDLLGLLAPEAVALEMQRAHAFLHASDYETYSAVCAEALCCGTFTIASNVGGIPEFLSWKSGHLVEHNDPQEWAQVIKNEWERALTADRISIAQPMAERCDARAVGRRYFGILQQIVARRP